MRLILLIGIICAMFHSSGQATKWEIGVGIGTPHYDAELNNITNRTNQPGDFKDNSWNYSLSLNYHTDSSFVWRVRVGMIAINQGTEINDLSFNSPLVLYKRVHIANQVKKYFAVGFLKMKSVKKLEFRGGIELPFIINGEYVEKRRAEFNYDSEGRLVTGYDDVIRQDLGYAYGITGLIGLRYGLIQQVSIGVELRSSLLHHVVKDGQFSYISDNDAQDEEKPFPKYNYTAVQTHTGLMLEIQYQF